VQPIEFSYITLKFICIYSFKTFPTYMRSPTLLCFVFYMHRLISKNFSLLYYLYKNVYAARLKINYHCRQYNLIWVLNNKMSAKIKNICKNFYKFYLSALGYNINKEFVDRGEMSESS
jgi:hypothetical protein